MKNLQMIVLPKITLYSPNVSDKSETEDYIKKLPNTKCVVDSCIYLEQNGKGRSWIFCNSLTYTIGDFGNFIVIKYTIGDSELTRTLVTNDIFYIDITEDT